MSDFVRPCNPCKPNDFQDSKYGKNMRVHTRDKDGNPKACTVCGKGGKTGK